jgi:hypothetical protein
MGSLSTESQVEITGTIISLVILLLVVRYSALITIVIHHTRKHKNGQIEGSECQRAYQPFTRK